MTGGDLDETTADDRRPRPGWPAAGEADHYFSTEPGSRTYESSVRLVVDGRVLPLVTASGVFSAHRIDIGTAVLLKRAPRPPLSGNIADIGCGYGAIACALAVRAPRTRVLAVDVNGRARELAQRNADDHRLSNITVLAPDEVADDVRLDAIYSNPPIRIGKAAVHELLSRWLARLRPDGHAYLVVHRHLGSDSLATWLRGAGHTVERLASERGYRVLAVGPSSGEHA